MIHDSHFSLHLPLFCSAVNVSGTWQNVLCSRQRCERLRECQGKDRRHSPAEFGFHFSGLVKLHRREMQALSPHWVIFLCCFFHYCVSELIFSRNPFPVLHQIPPSCDSEIQMSPSVFLHQLSYVFTKNQWHSVRMETLKHRIRKRLGWKHSAGCWKS